VAVTVCNSTPVSNFTLTLGFLVGLLFGYTAGVDVVTTSTATY
jgi:hypothetical protein